MILKAKYACPVRGNVIENAQIEMLDAPPPDGGRIVSIGQATHASSMAGPIDDYGDAILVPGFVNAHTHLELTHLQGRVPPGDSLVDWLRQVVSLTIDSPPDQCQVADAVRAGITQSLHNGVTTIGDITRHPRWTQPILTASPIRAVSFAEIVAIGTRRHLLDARLKADHPPLPPLTKGGGRRLKFGISPHSPYTVEPDGLRRCAQQAARYNMPICIHLAESPDEEAFVQRAIGPLRDYLIELGVWDEHVPASGCDVITLAIETGVLGPNTIAAHLNYVTDAQIERFASTGAHVAYCPRTHHAFGHPPHRFLDMIAQGINVCVATDSLASNPSLSVLDELRFLHRQFPHVSPDVLMEMGTIRGASALGWADQVGSLEPGKVADVVVIPIDSQQTDQPLTNVLESTLLPSATYCHGRLCPHDNNDVAPVSNR